jgi:hypothetical protein
MLARLPAIPSRHRGERAAFAAERARLIGAARRVRLHDPRAVALGIKIHQMCADIAAEPGLSVSGAGN